MAMGLTAAAIVAAVFWVVVVSAVSAVSAPRRVIAAAGLVVDPPALATLLTASYDQVGVRGARATQLDLIARGVLGYDADLTGGWLWPGVVGEDVRPYERQVLDLVTERAARGGGRAPAELTIGSSEQTKQWYEAFRDSVVADGRSRGLVAPRVSAGARALLYLTLLVPYALACLATHHPLAAAGLFLIPAVLLSLPVRLLARPVPRGDGRQAAALCRRTRAELTASPPPPGPVPGDRRLAYAVALGLPGDDTASGQADGMVWSNRTGTWTRIMLDKRRGVLAGSDPRAALWSLPGALLFFGIWLGLLSWFTTNVNGHQIAEGWPPFLVLVGWCIWTLLVAFIGRFIYRGLYDMTHPPVVIIGPIVQLESHVSQDSETPDRFYLAVDEGDGRAARTWEIPRGVHDKARLYQWARLTATPKLGHFRAVELLNEPSSPPVPGATSH